MKATHNRQYMRGPFYMASEDGKKITSPWSEGSERHQGIICQGYAWSCFFHHNWDPQMFILSWIITAKTRLIWGLCPPRSQTFIFKSTQLQDINHILLIYFPNPFSQWVEYFLVGQGQLWIHLSLRKKEGTQEIQDAKRLHKILTAHTQRAPLLN